MLGKARRNSDARAWTWNEVRDRTLAIYESERDGRRRMAVLVWQADAPQVVVADAIPSLLAFTMDVDLEPTPDNVVTLTGFDSLEQARAHCLEWTGGTGEVSWESLGEAAQIGIYASIREPGFAEPG